MEIYNLENKQIDDQINHYHTKLFPFAYNIIGDSMEAEDIVQEVINHYFLSSYEHVEKPDHYLTRAVINKSINHKKLLRNKRELYPGHWLPAPVFTEEGIYSKADQNRILNYSLLVLLEKLNPRERAVFILKETFDFSHGEIAGILEIAIENSRQLLKRAKQKLEGHLDVSFRIKTENNSILKQLSEAILKADIEKVKSLLAADIQGISDGGPKVTAARNIIAGKDRMYKLLKAIYGKYLPENTEIDFARVNHMPAVIYKKDGQVFRCMVLEIKDDKIDKIFIMVNPDKLISLNFFH